MDDVVVGLRLIVDIAPAQHTSSVHGTALRRCKPPVHVLQAVLERCGSLIQARQQRDPQHCFVERAGLQWFVLEPGFTP